MRRGNKSGQSILEVVIAMAVFALFAAAFVSLALGSFSAATTSADYLTAAALADEGLEAVRSIRDGAWNELTYNGFSQSAVSSSTGEWRLTGEGTSETIGFFTRVITFPPVGGAVDLYSKNVKSKVDWTTNRGGAVSVARETRLSNWDSRDWVQTDWSGGAGQNVWNDPSRYASDDGRVDISVVGELRLRFRPAVWNPVASPVSQNLNSVHCRAPNDCWAVGNVVATGPAEGRGELLIHWDGTAWTRLAPSAGLPDVNLRDVFCLAGTDCFAVGNPAGGETILRNAGGLSWTRLAPSVGIPDVALNSVFCLNQNDCWAVGNASGGELTIRWNGASWTRVGPSSAAPNVNLNSVFCILADDCWTVGAAGTIIRWDGATWSLFQDTGGQVWNDIFMLSASDGFLVGSGGTIRRFNGNDWNTEFLTGGQTWRGVVTLSSSDAMVAGSGGAIFRWDGTAWSPLVTGTNRLINSLILLSPKQGFAVGELGTILTLVGASYETAGELISSAFDLTDPSPVQIIEWDERLPICLPVCAVRLQIRTADNRGALGNTPWSVDFTTSAGALIDPSFNGRSWLQYRVLLAGDGNDTPAVQEIRINYK